MVRRVCRTLGPLIALALLAGLAGCATPIEVKQASKAQLDLLGTLEGAAADLQQSLDQFHKSQEERILQEGRIWIARQAIDTAYPPGSQAAVGAQALFDRHTQDVQRWLDSAFLGDDIGAAIAQIDARLKVVTDGALRVRLTNQKQDLEVLRLGLQGKPEAVKQMEAAITDDLKAERDTAAKVARALEILRAQIALMKALAARVDAWLAIDVTVTQEQADALKKGFSAAAGALGGAK